MNTMSKPRVIVLGAGFGGLELSTLLSETLGDGIVRDERSSLFEQGLAKPSACFDRPRPSCRLRRSLE